MMTKARYTSVSALVLALGIGGCAQEPTKQDFGMVIGGALGGLLGSQVGAGRGRTAAIIAGTLAGAVIGGAVGKSMDEVDRMKTAATLENVRTGVSSAWTNPDTGNQYTVTPVKTYETLAGPCQEYTVDAVVGGKPEKVYGTACRQADGSWKMQG
jgi:surface antigen